MVAQAGRRFVSGRVPGEEINRDTQTIDSSTFTTTETEVQSWTGPLVTGRIYRVTAVANFSATTITDQVVARLRENNVSGAELTSDVKEVANATLGTKIILIYYYQAVATGDKTFSLTGNRAAGSGTHRREAASNRPSYIYVDYISG